jgi:hypothetical protein
MRRLLWLVLLGAAWLIGGGVSPAVAAKPLAGKIVFLQGQVAVCRAGTDRWDMAQLQQDLFLGDAVRTGTASGAAILCADESQIKLNENTTLILKNIAPSPRLAPQAVPAAPEKPPASIYQVPQGEIWLRNKREKFHFELETPATMATIRGTELNIQAPPA